MNDSVIPSWIKDVKTQQEREIDRRQKYELEQELAKRILGVEVPQLWRQLQKELTLAIHGCNQELAEKGVTALLTEVLEGYGEQTLNVIVSRNEKVPCSASVRFVENPQHIKVDRLWATTF